MAVFGTSSTIQIDTVVFATDFSPASHNAGLYASAISVRFQTKLVVAHAFSLVSAAEEAELLTSKPSMQRRNLDHELALVADVLRAGIDRPETLPLRGDPTKTIPDLAMSRRPSLLVMGTHGGGRIDRFVLGSTAEGVLRNSSGAALTIGPNVNILKAGALQLRRILYATDCSQEAAHAAPTAVALSEAFGAELDVLNVVHAHEADHPDRMRALQQHFYGAVESYIPKEARRVTESHTFVCVGHPSQQILRHINERQIDLLVLGLRRNTHLGMQNSTSGAFPIIVAASCPAVTVAKGSSV